MWGNCEAFSIGLLTCDPERATVGARHVKSVTVLLGISRVLSSFGLKFVQHDEA